MTDAGVLRSRFRALHHSGCFVIPNPWDVGSAVRFERAGAAAIATTSSGLAWSLGKEDQQVTLDQLCAHVAALTAAVAIPVHVDAERCYADSPDGVAEVVDRLASVGAAGVSIEDFDPATGEVDARDVAVERVAAAARSAHRHDMALTARCEHLLYESASVDETVSRLAAYRDAGADVVYAPGPTDLRVIQRIIDGVGDVPHNVLLRGDLTVAEIAATGARRISTGGSLARLAYDAASARVRALLAAG